MDFKHQSKGKAISTSTPSISFRYNAEDEEIEQVYFPTNDSDTQKNEDSSINSSPEVKEETRSKDSSPILPKSNKRSGSLEDGGSPEPWRLFTEIRGRITKTVEEKIEEMRNDRIKLGKKKKLLNTSSLSDSEERSEASSSIKEMSDKSVSEKQKDLVADSDLGDISDTSLTPDRATPVATEVDLSEITPSKETLIQSSITRKSPSPPNLTPIELERFIHTPHKKTKTKSRGKIELGVEAVEETTGKEEGRITQVKQAGDALKQSSLMPTISVRAAVYFALLGILYAFVNVPQFLFGVIVGGFLSLEFSVWTENCFQWINRSQKNTCAGSQVNNTVLSPVSNNLSGTKYEGWLNEFCYEYQPEIYHVSQTETVYVRLEGSLLKLATPRQKISKRAIWNEPSYKLRFDRERTYDISGCDVVLLPEKLAHKRIWSKKYPICIILKPDSHLGTRYRERGTSSLDFVSFKGRSPKKLGEFEKSKEGGVSTDAIKLEEIHNENNNSDDEGEVVFYSDEEEDEDGLNNDYVKIPTSVVNKNNIYLFARTDREKDIWFRRLVASVKLSDLKCEESDNASLSETNSEKECTERPDSHAEHYQAYIGKLLRRKVSYQSTDDSFDISEDDDEGLIWFNLFLGRILFDPMHDSYWIKQIQEKIQKKLSAIKVPTFMEELLVSQVELSDSIPVIEKSCFPRLNDDGVWVDLDIIYKGTFKMVIDTKINIIKLKNSCGAMAKGEGSESPEVQERNISKPAIFDSEIEDSAESSCDDIDLEDSNNKSTNSRNTSHKVLQMVDKIASSKYFQQVTDMKYVKKALEGVSNTTISLVVEVKSLVGTVVLNFPPPPSDRLWYGFRPNTKLTISAKPRVGQRGINMAYITNYIEKKLLREFEKLLVMPNMDDLIIPVMNKSKPS